MKIRMTETRDLPGFGTVAAGAEIDHPEGDALISNGVAIAKTPSDEQAAKKKTEKP